MDDQFKAIVINQTENKFTREVKSLKKSFFKNGDILVEVDYSGLNYKDALILNDGGKLVKEYPHCLLYTSPSPRDVEESRMPSSA